MVRVLHRKVVPDVHRLQTRPTDQRSPPLLTAPLGSGWDQLPPANRRQLLHLLARLIERQVEQQTSLLRMRREEAEDDLHH